MTTTIQRPSKRALGYMSTSCHRRCHLVCMVVMKWRLSPSTLLLSSAHPPCLGLRAFVSSFPRAWLERYVGSSDLHGSCTTHTYIPSYVVSQRMGLHTWACHVMAQHKALVHHDDSC